MKISAIILTYNFPGALQLVLESILCQKEKPYEVIIADDGSGNETRKLITHYQKKFPVDLKHAWHEDKGYRVSKIRNQAIKASTGDFLIFSDGDLMFHPYFFYDYRMNMKKGFVYIGSRVFLSSPFTEDLLSNSTKEFNFSFYSKKIEKNNINAIRFPLLQKRLPEIQFSKKLRGGLLGINKNDLMGINGWNEDFNSWGREDTELIFRLYSNGIKLKKLKFAGITYHLWHHHLARENLESNNILLNNTIKNKIIRCPNGIQKLNFISH